jgi:GT2 family glycosyltransferase
MGRKELEEMADIFIGAKENGGFAVNVNRGFKWVLENEKEECWIVSGNSDIEVYEGWFDELKKAADFGNGDFVGGLGFKGREVEGMPIEKYRENPGSKYTGNYVTEGGRLDDWMFPGGMYMVKKSALEKIGILDEKFAHGGYEDIDLFLRAKKAGLRLIMTPKMQYWHEEGATRFSEEEKGRQAGAEVGNHQYFIDKWQFKPHENILDFMQDNRLNF